MGFFPARSGAGSETRPTSQPRRQQYRWQHFSSPFLRPVGPCLRNCSYRLVSFLRDFPLKISLKSFLCHLIFVNCENFFRHVLNMSVERHPLFLLFSVRLRLDAFLMPQNALPEFPGCHGTASDPKEKADQINPCSNRKAVAKPPAKCQTKKKRRHKGQSELCQHCEIGNHPRPLLHILSLSAASFCQTLGSVSCFIFSKTHFHFCNRLVRLYHKRFHKTNEFVYFPNYLFLFIFFS